MYKALVGVSEMLLIPIILCGSYLFNFKFYLYFIGMGVLPAYMLMHYAWAWGVRGHQMPPELELQMAVSAMWNYSYKWLWTTVCWGNLIFIPERVDSLLTIQMSLVSLAQLVGFDVHYSLGITCPQKPMC